MNDATSSRAASEAGVPEPEPASDVHLHDYETPPSRPAAGRIVGLR